MNENKKAINLLKKYYLPHSADDNPSDTEKESAIAAGVFVPDSVMTHDEIVSEIKALSEQISIKDTAKAFLYSLSSGDTRYRTAISSLIWAKALPVHDCLPEQSKTGECTICGCCHGLKQPELIDWNRYGVFRYLPPIQYGNSPDFECAEYVLNDLREFEKLPSVQPNDDDYYILNRIFGAVKQMKSHNKAVALVTEIRTRKILNTTGNGIFCLLGVLSICGILETETEKGFLHNFTNYDQYNLVMDNDFFYPLNYWKGKNGVNYSAVKEIFGSFSEDKLLPEKSIVKETSESAMKKNLSGKKASKSGAAQYFNDDEYLIDLDDRYRHYYGLSAIDPAWEKQIRYSVTGTIKKRTVLYFEGNKLKKYIYEEKYSNRSQAYYEESDLDAETDNRQLLLPKTSRGRAKPLNPSLLRLPTYMLGHLMIVINEDHTFNICSFNSSNDYVLPLPPCKGLTKNDFNTYTEFYIASCPPEYETVLEEFRNKKRRTIKFKAGDIFRVQLTPTLYTYCLILGKVRDILKWKEVPDDHPLQRMMCQPIAFRQYALITENSDMTAGDLKEYPLMQTDFAQDNEILWETYPIVCHKELETSDIDFGFDIVNDRIVWGLTVHKLEDDSPDFIKQIQQWIRNKPEDVPWFSFNCSVGINICSGELTPGQISTDKTDDYYNIPKQMVIERYGLNRACPADDFAKRFGGITSEQYIEFLEKRI